MKVDTDWKVKVISDPAFGIEVAFPDLIFVANYSELFLAQKKLRFIFLEQNIWSAVKS